MDVGVHGGAVGSQFDARSLLFDLMSLVHWSNYFLVPSQPQLGDNSRYEVWLVPV